VKAEWEKLDYLRRLDAYTLDLSVLPEQQRRFLAGGLAAQRATTRSPRESQRLA
jgi:hypothetical protein